MQLAEQLARAIRAESSLELFLLPSPPSKEVVLWRPRSEVDLGQVRARFERSFVSITEFSGQRWFRPVAANPMAAPDGIVADVAEAVARIGAS